MADHRSNILQSAQIVFARYGVSKTTMKDIAQEAGVSRQTLYNEYASKEAILRAALQHGTDQTVAAVQAAWSNQSMFADKLDSFFEMAPLFWYDVVQKSPEIADLLEGINTIARDELAEATKRWNLLFETVILEHTNKDALLPYCVEDVADYIYSSSMNAKYGAANRQVLETRLKLLKRAVLVLLDAPNNA